MSEIDAIRQKKLILEALMKLGLFLLFHFSIKNHFENVVLHYNKND